MVHIVSHLPNLACARKTYIDELFQIIVEVGKIFSPLLVLKYEFLLPLEQLLTLLLKGLALSALILNTRHHQGVLIRFGMFWVLG